MTTNNGPCWSDATSGPAALTLPRPARDPGADSNRPDGRRSAEPLGSYLAARSGSAVSIPCDATAS